MVLDSIAGQDKKTAPPATPFANCKLQDEELLSVEGNKLGDRLPGPLWPLSPPLQLQALSSHCQSFEERNQFVMSHA